MARPIPTWPRGPRRRRPASPQTLLACPRVSPEWELSTLAALMRPTPARRGKVEHRGGGQPGWPADAPERVAWVLSSVADRLGLDLTPWALNLPAAGEYFLLGRVPPEMNDAGRAVAVALSRAVPDHWFVLGRLFLLDGHFYRRRRGYRLDLVRAADVHLRRDVRARLRGLV